MTVLAQRDRALMKANQVRLAQWQVKRNLLAQSPGDARSTAAELLRRPSGVVPSMRVRHLLASVPRVGTWWSSRLLAEAGIVNGDRRVGELTVRQRLALADALTGNGKDAT